MYKYAVLVFGYVENLSAAQIVFSRDPYVDGPNEFETEKELLTDLVDDLLSIFKQKHGARPLSKKCCKKM